MTIGDRIKARRLELNMSVEELATKLNKNRATVYRYESNDIENFPITILEPLAKALYTTPAYLMGWSDTHDDSGKLGLVMEIAAPTKSEGLRLAVEAMLRASGYLPEGKVISEEYALEVSKILGFPYLMNEEIYDNMGAETKGASSATRNLMPNISENINSRPQYPSNALPAETEFVNIPILGSVSAGLGCLADNDIVGYEPWSASSIKYGHDYIVLRVSGDSMYPSLIEEDLVLVQCQKTIDSGKIAVVTVNGDEGVIKKVKYGHDWIELHSINPMYPVRRFEGEDVELISVMGLVVESKRKF